MFSSLRRAALDGSLKAARLPLDTAARLTGGADARLTIDRLDATVRDLAGRAFGDDLLREDAGRRHVAADERERALRLRAQARQTRSAADERLAEEESEAERERREAAEKAMARKQTAGRQRDAAKQRAATSTRAAKQEVRRDAERTEETVEARARRERKGALEAKAAALERKEAALTAEDEALRLRRAAAEAKAKRKTKA